MSDSDDTDILLLIPPDFFLAENSFQNSGGDLITFSSFDLPLATKTTNSSFRSCTNNCSTQNNNQLIKINQQIADLEIKSYRNQPDNLLASYENRENLHSPSGDWTASNSLDTTAYCTMNGSSPIKPLNYSTPKQQQHNKDIRNNSLRFDYGPPPRENDKFLKEIDYFLDDSNSNTAPVSHTMNQPTQYATNNVHSLAVETLKRHNNMLQNDAKQYQPLYNQNYNHQQHSIKEVPSSQQLYKPEPTLISLSQIWGPEGETETSSTMHEERLRRQHCEREIQSLQTRLLEYQQKISVAMKIDKTKDEAIARLQDTNSRLIFLCYLVTFKQFLNVFSF